MTWTRSGLLLLRVVGGGGGGGHASPPPPNIRSAAGGGGEPASPYSSSDSGLLHLVIEELQETDLGTEGTTRQRSTLYPSSLCCIP